MFALAPRRLLPACTSNAVAARARSLSLLDAAGRGAATRVLAATVPTHATAITPRAVTTTPAALPRYYLAANSAVASFSTSSPKSSGQNGTEFFHRSRALIRRAAIGTAAAFAAAVVGLGGYAACHKEHFQRDAMEKLRTGVSGNHPFATIDEEIAWHRQCGRAEKELTWYDIGQVWYGFFKSIYSLIRGKPSAILQDKRGPEAALLELEGLTFADLKKILEGDDAFVKIVVYTGTDLAEVQCKAGGGNEGGTVRYHMEVDDDDCWTCDGGSDKFSKLAEELGYETMTSNLRMGSEGPLYQAMSLYPSSFTNN